MNLFDKFFLSISKEKGTLISFLVHGIYRNEKEKSHHLIDPQDNPTLDQLKEFLCFFQENGYEFIKPEDIYTLSPNKKYALLTFDDGYFNNMHVLPMLKELGIPAIIYVTTNNIYENICYWWDIIYRERSREGISPEKIRKEQWVLKDLKYSGIQDYIIQNFGSNAFKPVADIDRPLTLNEFNELASNSQIAIGNHCENHALLVNYSREEVKSELITSQEKLKECLGYYPKTIAYPNGSFNQMVLDVAEELGFELGFSVIQKRTDLPFPIRDKYKINRFILKYNQLKYSGIKYRCDNKYYLKINDKLHRSFD